MTEQDRELEALLARAGEDFRNTVAKAPAFWRRLARRLLLAMRDDEARRAEPGDPDTSVGRQGHEQMGHRVSARRNNSGAA